MAGSVGSRLMENVEGKPCGATDAQDTYPETTSSGDAFKDSLANLCENVATNPAVVDYADASLQATGDESSSWRRPPLPTAPNTFGRPVWEPPILDYSHLNGEEYEKMREALLKYTRHDVARTTDIIDLNMEPILFRMYLDWVCDEDIYAKDPETRAFFSGLWSEIHRDFLQSVEARNAEGIVFMKNRDERGTYQVYNINIPEEEAARMKHLREANAPKVDTVLSELPSQALAAGAPDPPAIPQQESFSAETRYPSIIQPLVPIFARPVKFGAIELTTQARLDISSLAMQLLSINCGAALLEHVGDTEEGDVD